MNKNVKIIEGLLEFFIIFEMLAKNIKENEISQLQAFNFGIAEEDLFADKFQIDQKFEQDFYNLGGIPFGNITHKAQQHEDDMKFVNLDDLKIKGPIRLIKIDVEGMEMSVLRGVKNLLERDRPVLYLEWENREKIDEYDDFLSPLGYRYIGTHMPKLYHHENYFKNTKNIYENIVSKNVLFIHKDNSHELNFTF